MGSKPRGTGRHVALLRGINVGGHRRLPMADLRELLTELGVVDVATYIQSGNAVYSAAPAAAATLPERLHAAIERRFGYDVPIVVRTSAEWVELCRDHPLFDPAIESRAFHVGFLDRVPAAGFAALDALSDDRVEFIARGREIYLLYRGKTGASRVSHSAIERVLGVRCTMRNWRTVQTLAEMLA